MQKTTESGRAEKLKFTCVPIAMRVLSLLLVLLAASSSQAFFFGGGEEEGKTGDADDCAGKTQPEGCECEAKTNNMFGWLGWAKHAAT